jgi:hypothetical protein
MRNLALLCLSLFCHFIFANSNDTYSIQKVASPPTIDGQITDWQNIPVMTFSVHNTGASGTAGGFAQAVWDDEAIYFAFTIQDNDVRATLTNQDDNLFNSDDLVEIFLDFDGDGQNYVELGISAADVNYDMTVCPTVTCGSWSSNTTWDIAGLETAVTVVGLINNQPITDQGYFVEIKIPFSGLQSAPLAGFTTPEVSTIWKGNVYCINYATSGSAIDYLSWSNYTSFGFHQPNDFASFVFADIPVSVSNATAQLNLRALGENKWMNLDNQISSITVYDLSGQIVKTLDLVAQNSIDLNSLSKGIYFIQAVKSNQILTQKVYVR